MPISPFVLNEEDGFIQLRKEAEAHIELFSSLNDKIDKENYRIQMDVNMKEKKTEMNLVLFFKNSVSYQKILKVIEAIQPISWSIGSNYKFIEDSSSEKRMKLILKVVSV